MDAAFRARYERAAAITVAESDRIPGSDLFLRFFSHPFKPLLTGREGFLTVCFFN